MEEIKIKGIVLNSVDYKDSDKIVTVFSAEMGLVKTRMRGVRKNKAKLAFAVQPFAFVELMLIKNGNYYSCINASSIDQFYDITLDFDNYVFMLACLELCLKVVKENDPQPDLFMLLLSSLKSVCYDKINSMYVFIKFMIDAMKILGYNIEISKCCLCGEEITGKNLGFSFDYNGMLCEKCLKHNGYMDISQGEYSILKFINITPMEELSKLNFLSRNDLISVITLLIKDFRLFTDCEIESIKKFL